MKISFPKEKVAWISYDFANQSFVTIIVTVLFSVYFKDIIVTQAEYGTALWGRAIGLSMLLVVLLAPILGAIADHTGHRKTLLFVTTYTCIGFTVGLCFLNPGDITLAMTLFIVANFAFQISYVFYNSFLPLIVPQHEISRISGIAWGIGYLGGLANLLIIMPIIANPMQNDMHFRISFLSVAIFFAVFSIPTFIWLKDKKRPAVSPTKQSEESHTIKNNYILAGFSRLIETAKNVKKFHQLLKFLASYYLFYGGIIIVISFAAIYGTTNFGMTPSEMVIYFIIAQPASFLGAILFGYVPDRIGTKKSICITLILWVFVILGAYLSITKYHFYIVGSGAGFAMGACQANSRAMLAQLTPKIKAAEFFGFFSVIGGLAAITGPIVYGEVSRISGSQKNAILSTMVFFIIGLVVLLTVNEEKGKKVALEYKEGNHVS
jgi:UMF1 family MFS transporter